MAPKRAAGVPDDVEAKRCRLERLGEPLAEHGGDANLIEAVDVVVADGVVCLLYTSPSPRDGLLSRMPSSA